MKKLITLFLFLLIVGIELDLKAQTSFTKLTIGSVVTDSSDCLDASWADYDKDGDLDLFVTTNFPSITNPSGKNLLFQNNCNGGFTKVTNLPGGLSSEGNSLVCSWIDYDNDGNIDLYVGNYNTQDNYLYSNKGDGTFEKITNNIITHVNKKTDGIAWADYDNDGNVDLFLTNYSYQKNDLFHNNGDGTFTAVTTGAIVNDINAFSGASWADFDNDGDMDLYVTTKWSGDYRNCLYVNNGDGTFTKDTTNIIVSDPRMSNYYMGINYSSAWADYDNDLNLDLFVTSVYGSNYLYHNNGDGSFTSVGTGPVVTTTGLNNGGATWGDFDNDGDLDLFVSNFQKNYLYINNGDGTFTLDTLEIISNDTTVESYGASWADFDNDGDLDLFVPNAFGAPNNFLYLNIYSNNGNSNNWFKATLKGVTSNSSAIGARIYIKANINGNNIWQMREINAGSAYTGGGGGAVSGMVTHFGLGNATIIDSIKVVWPASHITQIFTNVPVDQFVVITEGSNVLKPIKKCTPDLPTKNFGIIKGLVYNDIDSNCIYNSLDLPIINLVIEATPGPYFVFSDTIGRYEFRLNKGTYQIKQASLVNDIWMVPDCQEKNYLITTSPTQVDSNYSFANNSNGSKGCCGGGIPPASIPLQPGPCTAPNFLSSPCPGYYHEYCYTINNCGTDPFSSSSLKFTVDSKMQFINVLSNPCNYSLTISGNVLTFQKNNLPAGSICPICIRVRTNTYSPPGWTQFYREVDVCNGTMSTYGSITDNASCSCDPNNKLVSPTGCGEENNIVLNDTLLYQIHFQNNGGSPAHDIVISDQLDSNLNITSLKIISSSHQITRYEIIPMNKLIIEFNNIELPDSATDKDGSMGYVIFSIIPKPNIIDGTQIKNQAGIYFDLNSVVLTNIVKNTLYNYPQPDVNFIFNHNCTNPGNAFDFQYTGNTPDNAQYLWEFIDATPSTSTQENPENILFNSSGYKLVSLTINRNGCSKKMTDSIYVYSAYSENWKKVTVCHNGHSITISINALPAHLAHGDCVGFCNSDLKSAPINNNIVGNSEFQLIPNPSNGTFIINFTGSNSENTIEIYDMLGTLVYKSDFSVSGYKINLNEKAKGVYFYKILSNNTSVYTGKLILK